jgi:hypothetical protein
MSTSWSLLGSHQHTLHTDMHMRRIQVFDLVETQIHHRTWKHQDFWSCLSKLFIHRVALPG